MIPTRRAASVELRERSRGAVALTRARGGHQNTDDGCRVSESTWFQRTGLCAASAAGAAWLVVMGMIPRHRVFISSETVSNYAHVWSASRVLVH